MKQTKRAKKHKLQLFTLQSVGQWAASRGTTSLDLPDDNGHWRGVSLSSQWEQTEPIKTVAARLRVDEEASGSMLVTAWREAVSSPAPGLCMLLDYESDVDSVRRDRRESLLRMSWYCKVWYNELESVIAYCYPSNKKMLEEERQYAT